MRPLVREQDLAHRRGLDARAPELVRARRRSPRPRSARRRRRCCRGRRCSPSSGSCPGPCRARRRSGSSPRRAGRGSRSRGRRGWACRRPGAVAARVRGLDEVDEGRDGQPPELARARPPVGRGGDLGRAADEGEEPGRVEDAIEAIVEVRRDPVREPDDRAALRRSAAERVDRRRIPGPRQDDQIEALAADEVGEARVPGARRCPALPGGRCARARPRGPARRAPRRGRRARRRR